MVVFERDTSARAQGFLIGLNKDGIAALEHGTFPALNDFLHNDHENRLTSFYVTDESGAVFANMRSPGSRVVDRVRLREILATSGEGVPDIRWGNPVVSYAETASGVTVTLADGRTETADILVGADGVHSVVRAQRVPTDKMEVLKVDCCNMGGCVDFPAEGELTELRALYATGLVRVMGAPGSGVSILSMQARVRKTRTMHKTNNSL